MRRVSLYIDALLGLAMSGMTPAALEAAPDIHFAPRSDRATWHWTARHSPGTRQRRRRKAQRRAAK